MTHNPITIGKARERDLAIAASIRRALATPSLTEDDWRALGATIALTLESGQATDHDVIALLETAAREATGRR